MSVDNWITRNAEPLAALGERMKQARAGAVKQYSAEQQLEDMEAAVAKQVLAVLKECQERRRRELWETLKLCLCIICIVGIICIATLLMAEVML